MSPSIWLLYGELNKKTLLKSNKVANYSAIKQDQYLGGFTITGPQSTEEWRVSEMGEERAV